MKPQLPNLEFELSVEQHFELRRLETEINALDLHQARELLLQVSRLLMMKDNIIRSLIRQTINS